MVLDQAGRLQSAEYQSNRFKKANTEKAESIKSNFSEKKQFNVRISDESPIYHLIFKSLRNYNNNLR
ncbi:MAG: hypothetical protein CUN53_09090, partial [Phototrophicales bacterium]